MRNIHVKCGRGAVFEEEMIKRMDVHI